jgi:uncharacterized protein
MEKFEPRQILLQLFITLRRSNRLLGFRELLDAMRAIDGGIIELPDDLRKMICLLWCHSREEEREFELIWQSLGLSSIAEEPFGKWRDKRVTASGALSTIKPASDPEAAAISPQSITDPLLQPEWNALPVRTPFLSAQSEVSADLGAYWPVSRRYLVYTWRYLRRQIADGPANVLDLKATVERVTREGFFLAPVFRRRARNQAHLVLLVDQDGSMVPFHRFTRELVETASEESDLEQVDVFYFHNYFAENVYADAYLSARKTVVEMLACCDDETSVLIISDAGAARGFRRSDRISSTRRFLEELKKRTRLLAWLNPMPRERWEGTSAQMISRQVRMFQMDADGFSAAIDVVRGTN